METTSAVITIAELLMILSSGSGQPNPSVDQCDRPIPLLLHTGPAVSSVRCYFNTVFHPVPIEPLSSGDYLVLVENEGNYWCNNSNGTLSNIYNWRKKNPAYELGSENATDLWNSITFSSVRNTVVVGRRKLNYSDNQQIKFELGKSNETRITHSGMPSMIGTKMLLTEYNNTCAKQILKDEQGVERTWPEIKLGDTHVYVSNNECVDARTCSWNEELGSHLTSANSCITCPITDVNLTWAANNLRNMARKAIISPTDIETAAILVNQALQVNYSTLSTAHQDLSSLVHALEAVLTRVPLSPEMYIMDVQPKVAIFVLNVEVQPPVAFVLESNKSNGDFEGSDLRIAESKEGIWSPRLNVAVVLPKSVINKTSHVALAIFSDDSAFQDPVHKVNSRILSLNMVGAPKLQDKQYVDIWFRPWTEKGSKACVFWDFTSSGGAWSPEGCELMPSAGNKHDVCRCTHLTCFAEIISPPGIELDPVHEEVLHIISIVGCSLSLTGLLGIFITGAVSRHWRAQLGNKILLHLSTAVFINMLVFLITDTELLHTGVPCIVLGVMLHYSVLASFCWMLVAAGLQFIRLVTVLGSQRVPHLLLKASVFAWGAPLLPVTVLLAVDVNKYTTKGRKFCYPEGLGFYLTVLCPVLMIVTANIIVFGMILHSLFGETAIKRHIQTGRKLAMQRMATSVLLFFLLGLSWVFGLMTKLSPVFVYLFCITATLQGFVLFLFFVLGKKQSQFIKVKSSTEHNFTTSTASTPAERAVLRLRNETIGL